MWQLTWCPKSIRKVGTGTLVVVVSGLESCPQPYYKLEVYQQKTAGRQAYLHCPPISSVKNQVIIMNVSSHHDLRRNNPRNLFSLTGASYGFNGKTAATL